MYDAISIVMAYRYSIMKTDAILPNGDSHRKPPFLRRVRIRGYKSIAFCDVALEPLTILVGRNGAGKTNFMDALGFFRDLLDLGVNEAVLNHGGAGVFCQTLGANEIDLEFEFAFSAQEIEYIANYRVQLSLQSNRTVQVEREVLKLKGPSSEIGFEAIRGEVSTGLEFLRSVSAVFFHQYRPDRLLLGAIGDLPLIELADGIRWMGVFNLHPDAMRIPQQDIGSTKLENDGRNIARAIEGLKEIEPVDLSRIKDYVAAIVPEIEDFWVAHLDNFETVRFQLRGGKAGKPLELNAHGMSDGTLRTLGALIAAFQIVLPHGYPSLVAIEEPDTALHPAAMHALVDALDEATLRTQIVLTTHSAELLDSPTIQPGNIRVVEMIDGQTSINTLDNASVEIVTRRLNTLGGLERDNLLAPNIEDRQRQKALERTLSESAA